MYMLPVINSLIINICAATINKQYANEIGASFETEERSLCAATINKQYANEIGASFETEERSLCVMIWIILLLTMGS